MTSNPAHGEVYSIQHFVIKLSATFVILVGGFLGYSCFPDIHDITEILLKVSLNTITSSLTYKRSVSAGIVAQTRRPHIHGFIVIS